MMHSQILEGIWAIGAHFFWTPLGENYLSLFDINIFNDAARTKDTGVVFVN